MVLESSYSFIDNRIVYDTHSLPEIIARFGIGNHLELRFGFNYEVGGAGSSTSGNVPDDFEEDNFNVWSPSTVLKVPFGEKWKAYAEYFGVFTDGRKKESTQYYGSNGRRRSSHFDS